MRLLREGVTRYTTEMSPISIKSNKVKIRSVKMFKMNSKFELFTV